LRACGARPSGGGQSKLGWPSGENPGITRRAVFSEGRTLCVRKYGPDASPGISFPPHASKMTRGPSGDMCRLGPSHPCGRAEPAPPGGASPPRMALRRKARDAREVFPEGRALRVRKSGPDASPDISFPPHASKMTRRPSGNMCRLGPSHPCGRAEPAPPRGASPARMALRRKARRRRERRFSRRDALCASACRGHTQTEASHSHRCVYDEPVGNRRRRSGWRYAFLPGVRSPPLHGGKPTTDGPTEEGPRCQGGFPGGTHSVRPRGAAARMARRCVATGAFTIRRWPKRGQCWG